MTNMILKTQKYFKSMKSSLVQIITENNIMFQLYANITNP